MTSILSIRYYIFVIIRLKWELGGFKKRKLYCAPLTREIYTKIILFCDTFVSAIPYWDLIGVFHTFLESNFGLCSSTGYDQVGRTFSHYIGNVEFENIILDYLENILPTIKRLLNVVTILVLDSISFKKVLVLDF